MARSSSGRVVIELDPALKRELHAELAREGLTMKDWFIAAAERYLASARQPALFAAEPNAVYSTNRRADMAGANDATD